ncbi:hypothetical protein Hypma_013972 [Hypsizygus marmoreus]|uniref:Uncharacterized protein n=1 Tax=Hypsizygus marmoreus TaxID=39966 RepID=A0A369K688_HYPMA|nr:hypothetical protein Hypma_013972 [Hypsizygus marmoreus]
MERIGLRARTPRRIRPSPHPLTRQIPSTSPVVTAHGAHADSSSNNGWIEREMCSYLEDWELFECGILHTYLEVTLSRMPNRCGGLYAYEGVRYAPWRSSFSVGDPSPAMSERHIIYRIPRGVTRSDDILTYTGPTTRERTCRLPGYCRHSHSPFNEVLAPAASGNVWSSQGRLRERRDVALAVNISILSKLWPRGER